MWDSVDAERVRTACDPAASADLAVLLITVGGFWSTECEIGCGRSDLVEPRRSCALSQVSHSTCPAPTSMQEGLAHLCLVGSTCTLTRAKIEANIPRKRGAAAAGYDKAMESFYDKASFHDPAALGCCEMQLICRQCCSHMDRDQRALPEPSHAPRTGPWLFVRVTPTLGHPLFALCRCLRPLCGTWTGTLCGAW